MTLPGAPSSAPVSVPSPGADIPAVFLPKSAAGTYS